jgi:hypothetical protein
MVGATGNGNWTQLAPADPNTWFQDYTSLMLNTIQTIGASNIDAILLSNELYALTNGEEYTSYWLSLVAEIRKVFTGKLGCNAAGLLGTWDQSQEFLHVTFLDSIDFLGISAYSRLSTNLDATLLDCIAGWSSNAYGQNLL